MASDSTANVSDARDQPWDWERREGQGMLGSEGEYLRAHVQEGFGPEPARLRIAIHGFLDFS